MYWVDETVSNPGEALKRGEDLDKTIESPEDTDAGFLARAIDLAGPFATKLLAGWETAWRDVR